MGDLMVAYRRKLDSQDITEMVSCLKDVVEAVTAHSAPYKKEVVFIRAFTDSVKVSMDGKELWIGKRFCYFNAANEGDVVQVDSRYLHEVN